MDRDRADLAGQAIIAREGASIAQVAQTIIHGDVIAAPLAPEPDLAYLFAHYRAFVVESFGRLDFRGLHLHAAVRLGLEQIYIPIEARPLLGGEPRCIHELVRAEPLLVVLGDPGSGKSTLVRFLLLALTAGDARRGPGLPPDTLPIFFPVAAFAAARARPGHADLAPLAYLTTYYAGLSQPDYTPLFARALAAGRALILLDGLDEVRADRFAIIHALEAFAREWDAAGNRFLVTSRLVGYTDAPLDPDLFPAVVIESLVDAQIRHFIDRWSRAYAGPAVTPAPGDLLADLVHESAVVEAERRIACHAESLAAAVFAEPHVAELARNPLLLTILALLHTQGARLPDRRVDLYRLCVAALAETWNRARSLSGRPVDVLLGDEPLDERFVVNLLGPVALAIHGEQAGGLVDQDDLESRIATTLQQADGLSRRKARRLARDFVELMRRDTGLLLERGHRRFAFLHLTFEEYLAARGLLESAAVADPAALLAAYAVDPRWREVVRLAVAAAPQREAGRLILALLVAPTAEAEHGRPTLLAAECLLDVGRNGVGGRAWDSVRAALLALVSAEDVSAPIRLAGGALLGRLGDPRQLDPSTGHAEHCAPDYWCDVAPGLFWFGDELAVPRHPQALRQCELAYGLRIARYPVTNAEFARFVGEGASAEPRWWTAAGLEFLALQGSPVAPAFWNADPNQPVVGVSWYEAAAFCAWLTAQGREAGWLYPGETLRLPTALEWERAARHTDRRRYPWGDEPPDVERACYAGAAPGEALGLRGPAPVGVFPAGAAACGALDLAGNVWEWTASLAADLADPAPHCDMSAGESPAVKGGASSWDAEALRCGASYSFHPDQRHNLLGFRMVWVASEVTS